MQLYEYCSDDFVIKALATEGEKDCLVVGSHLYYSRVFSDFWKQNFRFVCMDTRAFSSKKSDANIHDSYTLDVSIQDIENIRQKMNLQKMVLVGHSIHAFMVLEYAKRYPEHVSHLVLIGTGPFVGSCMYQEADRYFNESVCPERKILAEEKIKLFMEKRSCTFIDRMLAYGPRLWYDFAFNAEALWSDIVVNANIADCVWGSLFEKYCIENAFLALQCPVFLALGRYDYFNPPHVWEKYRKYFVDVTVRVFEKSGHTPQLEEVVNFDTEFFVWYQSKNK